MRDASLQECLNQTNWKYPFMDEGFAQCCCPELGLSIKTVLVQTLLGPKIIFPGQSNYQEPMTTMRIISP
jgi:hypothetical protein